MTKLSHRTLTSATKSYSSGNLHGSVAGLQFLQYRSYRYDISIYHVREHLLPLAVVYKALQVQKEFRDRLTSLDPIRYLTVVEGDEIPPGCIEAAYLPNVFHGQGSALALRSNCTEGRVEWFVFSGPIHETVLALLVHANGSWNLQPGLAIDDPRKIFDLVGYTERGLETRAVTGANREHRSWHNALCTAEEGKKNVNLTWKSFGSGFKTKQEQEQLEKKPDKLS